MQTEGRTVARASYASLYRNVRNECKNFYDFVRELISNSYDAMATTIDIFPHYVLTNSAEAIASVFAIYDDGIGMDYISRTEAENDGIDAPPQSSIDAYTQLGHSTNTGRESIGRFCYGSKQAFNKADMGFILVTRTERMPNDGVILINVDDIQHELLHSGGVQWRVVSHAEAIESIRMRLQRIGGACDFTNTIARLAERVRALRHGTVQIIVSRTATFHTHRLCHLDKVHRDWNLKKKSRIFKDDIEFSALYIVIRFCTRHGTALHDAHGQFSGMQNLIRTEFGDMGKKLLHRARLRLFCKAHPDGYVVPYGYPRYTEQARPSQPEAIRGNRMTDWSGCWARLGPRKFSDDAHRTFCVLWDQNSLLTLRTDFEGLSRRGHSRAKCESLHSVAAGFRVQACGVRICELPAFVIRNLPVQPNSELTATELKMLVAFVNAGEKGGAVCVIEGNFNLEPNRASLSQGEIAGLKTNVSFSSGLANALHAFINTKNPHGQMMAHLLRSHSESQRTIDEQDIEQEAERRRGAANSASRLVLSPTPATPAWLHPLCMTHFVPEGSHSHEQQLQHFMSVFQPTALYAAEHATPVSDVHRRALAMWRMLRATVHFSSGVDVLTIHKAHEGARRDPLSQGHQIVERTYNVEYKWNVSPEFNHPLVNTDVIVAWDLENLVPGQTTIEDKQECDATVAADDAMEGFGLCLRDIRDGDNFMTSRRDASQQHVVWLVSLRDLIMRTFEPFCEMQIHRAKTAPVSRERRKRARTCAA